PRRPRVAILKSVLKYVGLARCRVPGSRRSHPPGYRRTTLGRAGERVGARRAAPDVAPRRAPASPGPGRLPPDDLGEARPRAMVSARGAPASRGRGVARRSTPCLGASAGCARGPPRRWKQKGVEAMSETSVVHDTVGVRRRYAATPARVYRAWTDPAELERWYVPGDERWSAEIVEHDFRVGGGKRIRFGSAEERFTEDAHYVDIVPDQRICYAMTIARGDTRITV